MNFVTRAEQFTSDLFLRGVREKGRRALGPGMRSANGGAWQENDDIVASSFPTSYLRRIGLRDRGVVPPGLLRPPPLPAHCRPSASRAERARSLRCGPETQTSSCQRRLGLARQGEAIDLRAKQ